MGEIFATLTSAVEGTPLVALAAARGIGLPWAPRETWEAVQTERIRTMVAHAHRTVPFYRSWLDRHGLVPGDFRSPSDLARLPPIDKNLYRKIPNQFAAAPPRGNGGLSYGPAGARGSRPGCGTIAGRSCSTQRSGPGN